MLLEIFLSKLKEYPEQVEFSETISIIDAHYDYVQVTFRNGDLNNSAGENVGSCKIFSFAKLHDLSKQQTLACFGKYYREDVLQNPDKDSHQNIRNFMRAGWQDIYFESDALILKK